MPSPSRPDRQRLSSMRASFSSLAVVLSCLFAHGALAQTAAPKPAAATQFVNQFGLVGKSGLEAARIVDAKGFKTCSVVGGVLPGVPGDEPLLQCEYSETSPYGCAQSFQVIMQMNWEGKTLTVPEMVDQITAAPVQKVTTVCK